MDKRFTFADKYKANHPAKPQKSFKELMNEPPSERVKKVQSVIFAIGAIVTVVGFMGLILIWAMQ